MALPAMRKGHMRYFLSFLVIFLGISPAFCGDISLETLPFNKTIKENILAGEVFAESKVVSTGDRKSGIQTLRFSIAGLHPRSCEYALKKLSLYESYSKYLDFVKESNYDDAKQEIDFYLDHALLPYSMELIFLLPRVRTVGQYPFKFEIGILKDLTGMIYVGKYKNRCLFYTTANWTGPHTGFPNFIFEIFSQTLSKISMETLFRISSNLSH
jgi:hypothetical protein